MPKSVVLRCIEDDKVLMEVPVGVPFTPSRETVAGNMKCAMGGHAIIVAIKGSE